jgi:hypothetical protein
MVAVIAREVLGLIRRILTGAGSRRRAGDGGHGDLGRDGGRLGRRGRGGAVERAVRDAVAFTVERRHPRVEALEEHERGVAQAAADEPAVVADPRDVEQSHVGEQLREDTEEDGGDAGDQQRLHRVRVEAAAVPVGPVGSIVNIASVLMRWRPAT